MMVKLAEAMKNEEEIEPKGSDTILELLFISEFY
jgi:hypothetical protein